MPMFLLPYMEIRAAAGDGDWTMMWKTLREEGQQWILASRMCVGSIHVDYMTILEFFTSFMSIE